MQSFDPKFGSFLLTVVAMTSGWIAWWVARQKENTQQAVKSAENALNAKRDFSHLARNQEQISSNIAYGFKDIENRITEQNNEIREIKAYLIQYQNLNQKDSQ